MSLSPSESDGRFEGYASVFYQPDLSRDIVMPGAFSRTLADRKASDIRLLFQHDPAEPIGIWLDVKEDQHGLYCRGELNLNVQRARELYLLMKQGAIDGLSIGFKTVRAQRDAASGGRRLIAIDLWEISLVSFPLLQAARVTAFKSQSGDARHHRHNQHSHSALFTRARTLFNTSVMKG